MLNVYAQSIRTITAAVRHWRKLPVRVLIKKGKCFLCENAISHPVVSLCFGCRQLYAGMRWSGCTRCGERDCAGACNQLPWLSSVSALYTYTSHHRQLLISAKERQSSDAIYLLFEVYAHPVTEKLKELIVNHSIDTILIAHLRISRVVLLNWHPFNFWLSCANRAVKELCERRLLERPVRIQSFLPGGVSKRSHVSSNKRRSQVAIRSDKALPLPTESERNLSGNTLIVDDVLTSGGTLLKESTSLEALRGSSSTPMFHALTLYRTPCTQRTSEVRENDGLE